MSNRPIKLETFQELAKFGDALDAKQEFIADRLNSSHAVVIFMNELQSQFRDNHLWPKLDALGTPPKLSGEIVKDLRKAREVLGAELPETSNVAMFIDLAQPAIRAEAYNGGTTSDNRSVLYTKALPQLLEALRTWAQMELDDDELAMQIDDAATRLAKGVQTSSQILFTAIPRLLRWIRSLWGRS